MLYENLFFHQLFRIKFRKIFGSIKLGEKKDVYIVNFFFTKNHKKFTDINLGEKKDFYIVNFFFTKMMVFGEKKDFYIVNFFFTKILFLGEKKVYYMEIFFFTKIYVFADINLGEKKADIFFREIEFFFFGNFLTFFPMSCSNTNVEYFVKQSKTEIFRESSNFQQHKPNQSKSKFFA